MKDLDGDFIGEFIPLMTLQMRSYPLILCHVFSASNSKRKIPIAIRIIIKYIYSGVRI